MGRGVAPSPPVRLEAALAAWGPSARLEARLGGGNRNEVWAVFIGGTRRIARLSRRPVPALAWELDLLKFLGAEGMHVPTTLPALDGRREVEGLTVSSWLDGEPPTSESDWRAVLSELERLHALTLGWAQRPGFRSTRDLLEADTGGDVQLGRMSADVVRRVRAAWRDLEGEPTSVVHGDPGPGNVRIRRGRVGLLDWDEARVDVSLLDLADLPLDLSAALGGERLARARRAANAWEAAAGWSSEPEYARHRLELV